MARDNHDTTLRLSAMDFALKALTSAAGHGPISASDAVDYAETLYAFLKAVDTPPTKKV